MTRYGVGAMVTCRRTLLHKKAVGRSLAKGGEADGKRALDESPALYGVAGGGIAAAGVLSPKSVLTARLAPERST